MSYGWFPGVSLFTWQTKAAAAAAQKSAGVASMTSAELGGGTAQ